MASTAKAVPVSLNMLLGCKVTRPSDAFPYDQSDGNSSGSTQRRADDNVRRYPRPELHCRSGKPPQANKNPALLRGFEMVVKPKFDREHTDYDSVWRFRGSDFSGNQTVETAHSPALPPILTYSSGHE